MLIPSAPAQDESSYISRAREAKRRGSRSKCENCGCELRLRERLVKFLRCKFNNIRRSLEGRWKL